MMPTNTAAGRGNAGNGKPSNSAKFHAGVCGGADKGWVALRNLASRASV
jgi:hypothetical protein